MITASTPSGWKKKTAGPARKFFKEQFYRQSVADNIFKNVHFVLEERKKYEITITSEPSGAVVTQNSEAIGETPFTYIVREMVRHPRIFNFVATKEGYLPSETVLKEVPPRAPG